MADKQSSWLQMEFLLQLKLPNRILSIRFLILRIRCPLGEIVIQGHSCHYTQYKNSNLLKQESFSISHF